MNEYISFASLEVGPVVQRYDLMRVMKEFGAVFSSYDECFKYIKEQSFVPSGKYTVFSFTVDESLRLMDGAIAGATGNVCTRPWSVTIVNVMTFNKNKENV